MSAQRTGLRTKALHLILKSPSVWLQLTAHSNLKGDPTNMIFLHICTNFARDYFLKYYSYAYTYKTDNTQIFIS